MFAHLFRWKARDRCKEITVFLPLRAQPLQRQEHFDLPLDRALEMNGLGRVVVGGVEFDDDFAGILSCEIELSIKDTRPQTVFEVVKILERLGAPKGSELRIPGKKTAQFGTSECLALCINTSDWPVETYVSAHIPETVIGLTSALETAGRLIGTWEGSDEIVLYFYGAHFPKMKKAVVAYCVKDTLCANYSIKQIV